MQHFLKDTLILLIIIIAISCRQQTEEPKKEEWKIKQDKQTELDTLNKNQAYVLSIQKNAIIGWDTASNFTYQLQSKLNIDKRPLSFIGHINDIIKRDSNYILKATLSNDASNVFSNKLYLAEISIPHSIFERLNTELLDYKHTNEGCFIFTCNKIWPSSQLQIDSEISDDNSPYLTYNFDDILIFLKGDLVDFYLYKKLEDDK